MILDLSQLNENVEYYHFKMDTFQSAILLVTKASIDLRYAYYSIPIAVEHRKFLKFFWKGVLWQFKCLPNGLSSGPRLFTKVMKPPFATLRAKGHTVLSYLDDSIVIHTSKIQASKSVNATAELLSELGFIIHPEKSQFTPVQRIQYLGFIIDSRSMSVTLPQIKKK